MHAMAGPYQKNIFLHLVIFCGSSIAAIVWQQPLLIIIPFAWLLFPFVVDVLIRQPEKLFWWLLICLPLSTELNLTPELGLDFPDEILLMLLTAIVCIQLVYQPNWLPVSLLQHPIILLLAVYFFWLLIAACYSVESLLSLKYVLAKAWYIIPLVLLPQVLFTAQSRISKIAIYLLIPMLLVVIQTLVRHAWYGFSFEKVQQTLAPFFRNHVNYSSMLVCLLPIAWAAWKLLPVENKQRKWVLAGLMIGVTGLLFAYSRGAWVALLAGITAAWIIRKRWMGQVIFIAITIVLISTVWLITDNRYMRFAPNHDQTIFHTDFKEHLQATIALKDVSNAERFYRWIAGAKMMAEKPVTGFGPNTFYLHYKPYTVSSFETWVSDNKEHSTVHNYFILTALEQGMVGLLLFCTLYFGMLWHVQKLYHRFQSRFYQYVTLTIGIILVMIGVINSLSDMIETDKIGSLFWLCLGMIVLLDTKNKEEREAIADANIEC